MTDTPTPQELPNRSADRPADRIRMNAAHELAHLVMHQQVSVGAGELEALVCWYGTPWLDHFEPSIGTGLGCHGCQDGAQPQRLPLLRQASPDIDGQQMEDHPFDRVPLLGSPGLDGGPEGVVNRAEEIVRHGLPYRTDRHFSAGFRA